MDILSRTVWLASSGKILIRKRGTAIKWRGLPGFLLLLRDRCKMKVLLWRSVLCNCDCSEQKQVISFLHSVKVQESIDSFLRYLPYAVKHRAFYAVSSALLQIMTRSPFVALCLLLKRKRRILKLLLILKWIKYLSRNFGALPKKKIKPTGAFEKISIHIFMTHLKTLLKKHILTTARKGLNCV